MRFRVICPALVSALIFCSLCMAQTDGSLTDAQVSAAIDRALHGRHHQLGLRLNDVQTAIFSGVVCKTCGTSGYTIWVYTAESWIETQAVRAKREMLPFGLSDVTPDMRLPYIRVLALPSTADYITGAGLSMASSVHRVVLSSTDRSETVQPLESSTSSVEGNSAFRSVEYTSAGAVFSVSDVERLRHMDKNQEFFVVVVGDNQNKFFKVKSRFFKQLFGQSAANASDTDKPPLVTRSEERKVAAPAPHQTYASTSDTQESPTVAIPKRTEVVVNREPLKEPSAKSPPAAEVARTTELPNIPIAPRPPRTVAPPSSTANNALGVTTSARADNTGVDIVRVARGSVAASVGLHVTDVIYEVDGIPVNSSVELETELARKAPGTKVRLSYMFRMFSSSEFDYYSNEKFVVLGSPSGGT